MTCGWTGWSVVGLVCPGYPSSLVCPSSLLFVLGILVMLYVLDVQVLNVLVLPFVLPLFLQQIYEELSAKISVSCHKFILFFYDGYLESCLQRSASLVTSLSYSTMMGMCGELSVKSSVSCIKIILFSYNGYVESCLQRSASLVTRLSFSTMMDM